MASQTTFEVLRTKVSAMPCRSDERATGRIVTPYARGYRDGYQGKDAAQTDPDYVQGFCDGFRDRADDPPCKNEGFVVVGDDGECLRCGADQGEACRS